MTTQGWIGRLRRLLAPLMLLALFIVLWQRMQAAAAFEGDQARASSRVAQGIRQAAGTIIQPGDTLLLTTADAGLRQVARELGADVYEFDPTNASAMNAALMQVLNNRCEHGQALDPASAYWIWTLKAGQTPMLLGQAARALNFYFAFEALLPYSGDEAFAIDKVLRLEPKAAVVERYCEAAKVAGASSALVILDADRFSPWIGSVVTGPITWLASGPERKMNISDFAVKDMPPLITYDVYWMGQLQGVPSWLFTSQDMAAYELAVQRGRARGSVVLVDRDAQLGITALRYLRECRPQETSLESSLFTQMCYQ